ncbi:hypothetical protein G9A89_016413 [Geosiphon pyriformis]|nr:hypothetical protein G9A89_016413 [Geosiphon pyriformis]
MGLRATCEVSKRKGTRRSEEKHCRSYQGPIYDVSHLSFGLCVRALLFVFGHCPTTILDLAVSSEGFGLMCIVPKEKGRIIDCIVDTIGKHQNDMGCSEPHFSLKRKILHRINPTFTIGSVD